jgi:type II secretory pathway component GspD/PulD (secretin)
MKRKYLGLLSVLTLSLVAVGETGYAAAAQPQIAPNVTLSPEQLEAHFGKVTLPVGYVRSLVPLHNLSAAGICAEVTKLPKLPEGVVGYACAEPHKVLVVMGTPQGIERMRAVVRVLDKPYAAPVKTVNTDNLFPAFARPGLETVRLPLQHVSPSDLGPAFKMFPGLDSVVAIDAQNSLLVRGTKQAVQQAQEIVKLLDKPWVAPVKTTNTVNPAKTDSPLLTRPKLSRRTAMLPLQNVSPSAMLAELEKLAKLPEGLDSVVAIDAQNSLLVRGTQQGIEQLQQIASEFDKPLDKPGAVPVKTGNTLNTPIDASTIIEQNKRLIEQNDRIIALLEQLANKK